MHHTAFNAHFSLIEETDKCFKQLKKKVLAFWQRPTLFLHSHQCTQLPKNQIKLLCMLFVCLFVYKRRDEHKGVLCGTVKLYANFSMLTTVTFLKCFLRMNFTSIRIFSRLSWNWLCSAALERQHQVAVLLAREVSLYASRVSCWSSARNMLAHLGTCPVLRHVMWMSWYFLGLDKLDDLSNTAWIYVVPTLFVSWRTVCFLFFVKNLGNIISWCPKTIKCVS